MAAVEAPGAELPRRTRVAEVVPADHAAGERPAVRPRGDGRIGRAEAAAERYQHAAFARRRRLGQGRAGPAIARRHPRRPAPGHRGAKPEGNQGQLRDRLAVGHVRGADEGQGEVPGPTAQRAVACQAVGVERHFRQREGVDDLAADLAHVDELDDHRRGQQQGGGHAGDTPVHHHQTGRGHRVGHGPEEAPAGTEDGPPRHLLGQRDPEQRLPAEAEDRAGRQHRQRDQRQHERPEPQPPAALPLARPDRDKEGCEGQQDQAPAQVGIAFERPVAARVEHVVEPAAVEGLAEQGRALRVEWPGQVRRKVAEGGGVAERGLADAIAEHPCAQSDRAGEGGQPRRAGDQAARPPLGHVRGCPREHQQSDRKDVVGVDAGRQRAQTDESRRAAPGQAFARRPDAERQCADLEPVSGQGHVVVPQQPDRRQQRQQRAGEQGRQPLNAARSQQGHHRQRLQHVAGGQEQRERVHRLAEPKRLQRQRQPGDRVGVDDRGRVGRIQRVDHAQREAPGRADRGLEAGHHDRRVARRDPPEPARRIQQAEPEPAVEQEEAHRRADQARRPADRAEPHAAAGAGQARHGP